MTIIIDIASDSRATVSSITDVAIGTLAGVLSTCFFHDENCVRMAGVELIFFFVVFDAISAVSNITGYTLARVTAIAIIQCVDGIRVAIAFLRFFY